MLFLALKPLHMLFPPPGALPATFSACIARPEGHLPKSTYSGYSLQSQATLFPKVLSVFFLNTFKKCVIAYLFICLWPVPPH